MGKKRMATFTIVLLVLFASVIATVIALNFVSGEKKIKQAIDKRYSIDDPQFLRSMGVLLGPAIVPGNRVQTLVNGDEIFPALVPVAEQAAQMFKSSPGEGAESMRLMYLLSINAAQKSVQIANSYFVPDDLTIETLEEAMKRGVRVQIIVPGTQIDTELVRKASRALGQAARGWRRNIGISTHHVSLQGDGRG